MPFFAAIVLISENRHCHRKKREGKLQTGFCFTVMLGVYSREIFQYRFLQLFHVPDAMVFTMFISRRLVVKNKAAFNYAFDF